MITLCLGQGRKVHISGFILYPTGEWLDTDISRPDKMGNWSLEKLEAQTKKVVELVEADYPSTRYQHLYLFDNSTIHTRRAADALFADGLAKKPGGAQLSENMRDTKFTSSDGACEQSMTFQPGHVLLYDGVASIPKITVTSDGRRMVQMKNVVNKKGVAQQKAVMVQVPFKKGDKVEKGHTLCGIAKGAKYILVERGLLTPDERMVDPTVAAPKKVVYKCKRVDENGKKQYTKQKDHTDVCCMVGMLLHQVDFKEQRQECKLKEIIEGKDGAKTGHKFWLLPKFHCEFAPIERCWGRMKWYLRTRCNYSISALLLQIPQALDQVTDHHIQKYFNLAFTIMGLYRDGLTVEETTQRLSTRAKQHDANRSRRARAASALNTHANRVHIRHRGVPTAVDRILSE